MTPNGETEAQSCRGGDPQLPMGIHDSQWGTRGTGRPDGSPTSPHRVPTAQPYPAVPLPPNCFLSSRSLYCSSGVAILSHLSLSPGPKSSLSA